MVSDEQLFLARPANVKHLRAYFIKTDDEQFKAVEKVAGSLGQSVGKPPLYILQTRASACVVYNRKLA